MLGDITAADEIYIVTGRTDMRKSIDGLCAIVEDQLHMDPRRSALYLFCGKRCDRIKALLWESDGAANRRKNPARAAPDARSGLRV